MLSLILTFLLLGGLAAAGFVALEVRRRNAHIWLPAYIRRKPAKAAAGTKHVLFCFVDHYEPQWGKPSYEVEVERVDRWREYTATGYKLIEDWISGAYVCHQLFRSTSSMIVYNVYHVYSAII